MPSPDYEQNPGVTLRSPPVNVKRPDGALNVCAPLGRFLILGAAHRRMCGKARQDQADQVQLSRDFSFVPLYLLRSKASSIEAECSLICWL